MRTLVEWSPGEHNSYYGVAGSKVLLFTINWKLVSKDPDWVLRTTLPGLSGPWKSDDRAYLERVADKVLESWLAKIGVEL